MRIAYQPNPMEFGGHRFDDSVLTCNNVGGDEEWSIDLPAVMWILELIAAGEVDPRSVAQQLRTSVQRRSGCCGDCDVALPYYNEARVRYEEIRREWQRQQEELDPDEYSYVLNKGKIHTLSCRRPPAPSSVELPADLHAFSALFDACNRDLEAVFAELHRRSSSGARRIAAAYIWDYVARHGMTAVQAKLCRSCKPAFPEGGPAKAALRPACWSWSVEPARITQLWAAAAESPNTDVNVLAEHRVAYTVLERWQEGRCAVCADPQSVPLVRDHDRRSGQMRGLLCNPCNTTEGRSTSALFENYRTRPPAVMLAVEILYLPSNFVPGTGHLPPTTLGTP
ncbi:hypothetical protein GWI34_13920 [Actinomadura sp. DSM 109109]|nr:hypothetical protein [Actinomadura lepetitiana]